MPRKIKGLQGSCLVIPCSFSYYSYPPRNPNRVVWYKYVDRGYPIVYDEWHMGHVTSEFRGKTSLYESGNNRRCNLLIKDLNQHHHAKRLYAWIDPENVGWSTFKFYEVTCEISIRTSAEQPNIQITGGNNIGDTIKVQCSTYHTCPYEEPTLSLSGIQNDMGKQDKRKEEYINNGFWKLTITREGIIQSEQQTVECYVRHPGGLSAMATASYTAECSIYGAKIIPDSSTEVLEGVEKNIICSVKYKCPRNRPYITWSYGLSGSMTFSDGATPEARSTLKFTAKSSDNGRVITCRTELKGKVQEVSISLKVKRSMFSRGWTFTIPNAITGLRGSCVVIPCSFDFQSMPSNVMVKWYKFSSTSFPLVYDQSTQNIISSFRGKTSLYGSPNDKNCSLKIQPLELQHNQERLYPWMDPKPIDSYHRENYYDVTIALEVTDLIEKPQVDIFGTPKVGEQLTLSCSMTHTCPPTPPTLSLSVSHGTQSYTHTPLNEGKWQVTKKITWDVQEDDVSVTCTARYSSGQTSMTEMKLSPLCVFRNLKISPTQEEVMEGIKKIFSCSVEHICQKKKPTLVWNYQNMPVSIKTQKISNKTWETVSTLEFTAGTDDNGKTLTCTAQSSEDESSVSVDLKVKRGMSSLNWTYSMPNKIKGLSGSCLVIPCSYDFKTKEPTKISVKWYEYSTGQSPVVYDPDTSVTGKFWGKTELYESGGRNCSLKINPLMNDHNKNRLFPWMDQNSVDTFHKENLYENCVELEVQENADKPKLSISGIPVVGEKITVSCSVYHTCPFTPPTLNMGKDQSTDRTEENPKQDAVWETTRHHTFSVKEDDTTVTCKATFTGGKTSEAQINLNAQCTHKDISIEPELADVTEGMAQNFTCQVVHSCQKEIPTISWNYADMPETVKTKHGGGLGWITTSNMLFLASMQDNGKQLICTAQFPYGNFTTSVVLHVQKFVPKIVDPFENDTLHTYEANVVPRISALTRSCVVIPCSFQTSDPPITRLRGLWYSSTGEYVYHTGRTNIMDNFLGRTKLLGNPDEQNCTLEIDDVKAHDNGPFCFRAEKGTDKYSFNHSCVFIIMKASPNKPVISALPEELKPGKSYSVSCSVTHTCPSHPPTIQWSISTAKEVVTHMETSEGEWTTTSKVTFIPTGYEKEEDELICTASFWRGKKQATVTSLPVERFQGMRMDTIGPYILTPLVFILLLCGIVIVGVVIYKKKFSRKPSEGDTLEKRRSIWAQFSRRSGDTASWLVSQKRNNAPSRPPKTNRQSIWSRFSRRGPVTNDMTDHNAPIRPPKPDKRRSIWSRFSRRYPDNSENLRVEYNAVSERTEFSKPHFPSPKSDPKSYSKSKGGCSANYDADFNLYANA